MLNQNLVVKFWLLVVVGMLALVQVRFTPVVSAQPAVSSKPIASVFAGPAARPVATGVWCEDFTSSLDNGWSWVRPDTSHWSLATKPGYLRITATRGDLWAGANTATNLLLRQPTDSDFSIITQVTIAPFLPAQQAGLLVYQDDDNYVRLTRGLMGTSNKVEFASEQSGAPTALQVDASSTTVFLAITKNGALYSGYYSLDGLSWNLVTQNQNPTLNIQRARVGIGAWTTAADEIPADFYSFCMSKSLPTFLKQVPMGPTSTTGNACNKWDLASDFRPWPNQENPNRDSCGNPNVWYFMGNISLDRNPSSYYLFPDFWVNHDNVVGLVAWGNKNGPAGVIAFNASGVTQHDFGEWTANRIVVHPGPSSLSITGWRSPMDGNVKITGSVVDKDPNCGDGINWYIDKGSKGLAAGSFNNGGGQEFQNGMGGSGLANVAVNRDEFIYLIVHPKGGYDCDSTFVNFTISK